MFLNHKIKNNKTFNFLTHFSPKFSGHNLEYGGGNFKGVVIYDNYLLVYFYLLSYYFKDY
jgi:hypothetical protein